MSINVKQKKVEKKEHACNCGHSITTDPMDNYSRIKLQNFNLVFSSKELSKLVMNDFPQINQLKNIDIKLLQGLTESIFTGKTNHLLDHIEGITNRSVRESYESVLKLAEAKKVSIKKMEDIDTLYTAGKNELINRARLRCANLYAIAKEKD